MIKRTPPNTPPSSLLNMSDCNTVTHSNTDSTDKLNITQRKRKREETELHRIEGMVADMKSMFSELISQQTKQNNKIENLQSAVNDIRFQNNIIKNQNTEIRKQSEEIQNSMDFLSHKYDDMVEKVNHLQLECNQQQDTIKKLEHKIEYLERNLKVASLEFQNVPLLHPESKTSLIETVVNISKVVNKPVQKSEIKEIFRTKSQTNKVGTIIVEFSTSSSKDEFLKSIIKFNKEHKENRLNTSHLQMHGPKKPIFVSEALTARTKRLYFLGREFVKNSNFDQCWTANGKVYVRKGVGHPSRLIISEEDIEKLRKEK